ncbi:hypothetical protein CAOG_07967 [Capsaspora owczarzaki ATCC 30864]|uniref:Uncharacterized protein n=1 Tax=Capsaspora owczarzaki (strain ATCC 30864) TaxID=595528 RepID=A0A0D2WYB8_CAPO3|nr:hypothetical protein CAOG_07967 [Capsaspora owczarzaki ATCC 30864]KJE97888.1 hypothetical protein CAOG_007967 [Capsaspora owczarzaki ATCC 30864]|eukprot:XP_004343055.1 hypothetical protein CAOG_07967 [Capsaspora owczarzaki ATCC 30864]
MTRASPSNPLVLPSLPAFAISQGEGEPVLAALAAVFPLMPESGTHPTPAYVTGDSSCARRECFCLSHTNAWLSTHAAAALLHAFEGLPRTDKPSPRIIKCNAGRLPGQRTLCS